jgi:membrane protein DedA with SNARE-associated domain
VAGLAEALAKFSGCAAGYGGHIIIEDRPECRRVHGWMQRHGALTIFLTSVLPNPLFDLAGLTTSAVQMPLGRIFLTALVAKVVKDWYLAAAGGLGVALFTYPAT